MSAGRAGWWRSGLWLDFRYALRVLGRSRAFTAVAVLSLAIGIGANTAIFGAVRFALLDPMPVDHPEQLRLIYWTGPSELRVSQMMSGAHLDPATNRSYRSNYSYPTFRALAEANHPAADVCGFNFLMQLTVASEGRPAVAAGGLMVSGNFFDVLRPGLTMGRPLGPADDSAAAAPVTVVSHAFWVRALGADPQAVGKTIAINGSPFVVVGVTAKGFRGISTGGRITPLTDVTIPISKQPLVWTPEPDSLFTATDRLWVRVLARLKPGARAENAASTFNAMLRQSLAATGLVTGADLGQVDVTLLDGTRGVDALRRNAERPLVILSGVVGVVLLIACVNLAGLMLARGVGRQRELSVRRALGAGRARLIRQLLIEGAVLAAMGGAAGLLIALWTTPIVAAMLTTGFGVASPAVPVDWRSVGATAAAALAAVALFGLLPAIGLTRADRTTHLRHQVAGQTSPRLTLGRGLLALQIGISVPLVVAAALLLRTIHNLEQVDLGFDPRGLVTFRLDPNQGHPALTSSAAARDGQTQQERIARFTRQVLAGLEAIPGVTSATLTENALVSGWMSNNRATVDGKQVELYMNGVGPRFFETMRIPLLAGRAPTLDDVPGGARVVVINQSAARQLFGEAPPLGRRFTFGRSEVEVVGVAADSKYDSLRAEIPPTLFDPFLQRAAAGAMNVAVRTADGVTLRSVEAGIRGVVAAVDASVPVTDLRSQRDQIDLTIGKERLITRLLVLFGGFALLLACIGLYGITSYSVARRTNEIGIRLALGAQRAQVVWLVLRQVLVLAAAGLAIGIPAAILASPLVASFLYGLESRDATTVIVSALILFAVAIAAGALPARRAARMEALTALRHL